MGIGTVIFVSVATFFVLGGVRRMLWMRHSGRWGRHGRRRMGGYVMNRRIKEEEAEMLAYHGDEYAAYMRVTDAVLPNVW